MELGGQLLGDFKAAYVGNRVTREHGEVNVAVRTSGSLACEPKRYRAMRLGTDFLMCPISALSSMSATMFCADSGSWFGHVLSIVHH